MTAPARSPDPAAEAVSALREAGQTAYEARFAGRLLGPRGVSLAWRDLPQDDRAIWVEVEAACAAPLLADIAALRTRMGKERNVRDQWTCQAHKFAASAFRLAEENARLRVAMKPFAAAADAYPVSPVARREDRRRHELVWSCGSEDAGNRREISVDHLRAAARALTATGGTTDAG